LQASDALVILSEFWPWGLRQAGSDPLEVLARLQRLGFALHELNHDGSASPLGDHAAFTARFPGRKYANIVAQRKEHLA